MAYRGDLAFLSRLAIRRWKARFPFWPPQDASPVTPIEPWGKQFFVYNAPIGVELKGDPRAPPLDAVRPAWVRDEDAASMLLDGEDLSELPAPKHTQNSFGQRAAAAATNEAVSEGSAETVLCATDFRQRPLLFLKPDEWAEFLQQLPSLREQLRRCQEDVDALDQRGAEMRDYALRRKYIPDKHQEKRQGRMGYGSGFGRSYETGKVGPRARERKTRVTGTELRKYNEGLSG
mmetsp:Transcript_3945/g.10868  ORF Transcript_3945/g.10868 Transcript_3945/m.10868 type:complete len:233 (-) Transcript_3945:96-794(-)